MYAIFYFLIDFSHMFITGGDYLPYFIENIVSVKRSFAISSYILKCAARWCYCCIIGY